MTCALPIEQHDLEIHGNAAAWQRKKLLRDVYRGFYEAIAQAALPAEAGFTVELGSGLGNIKTVLPHCITTDIFANPWLDRVENAYHLSFEASQLGNLILFDVWHHLEHPGTALAEFARVLRPGGRLILFEPAMSWLGRMVYGLCHHEPLGLGADVQWHAPATFDAGEQRYYAAQGNCWRTFVGGEFDSELSAWHRVAVKRLSALSYIGSGGFRGPQLYPDALGGIIGAAEKILDWAPSLFATRMLVVLEKR